MNGVPQFIGISLGRYTHAGLVDASGRISYTEKLQTDLRSGQHLLKGLIPQLEKLRKMGGGSVKAIGMALPGLIDHARQEVEILPNFPSIAGLALTDEIKRVFDLPLLVENDANAGGYGEWRAGAARDTRDAIFIYLGTGIGCSLILGGSLHRGTQGFAGEFGHIKIGTEGIECSCGMSGCIETVASGPNIVRRTRERAFSDPRFAASPLIFRMDKRLSSEEIVAAAREGDELASAVLAETAQYLGIAISNVVNLLNVERVVLGGPMMGAGQFLLDIIREAVAENTFTPLLSSCRIVAGELADKAEIIGSALLARDETAWNSG